MGGGLVSCIVLGTVMETKFVDGHKHLVVLSVVPSSCPIPGLKDPSSCTWDGGRGIEKSQLVTEREAAQSQVPVQEAGAAATVGGSSKPTAE